MSLIQSVSNIKSDALNGVVCPVVIRIGVQAIPAASLLIGEVCLSSVLQHGVILPSPIGVELLEFPSKMIYLLERRRFLLFQVSRIPRRLKKFRYKASRQG